MTIFYTSDTHFCHKNILQHENRPFNDIDEMDTALIEQWNKTVGKKDTVYHLGDFVLGDYQVGKDPLATQWGNSSCSWES